MLEELEIRNLGPIRHALVTPAAGMTAITGETGAGKSMLLNALRLVSGGAARSEAVSAGADATWAQAVFTVLDNPAARAIAQDAGCDVQDGELFISRSVPASGRSRCVLSGHGVPRSVLSALAGELITIHGQADQLRIASAARQREFLDAYAGDGEQLAAYEQAWDAYRTAQDRLDAVGSQQAQARARADYLRESIARIDGVAPVDGEYDQLRQQRDRLEHAADIARGIGVALSALDPSQLVDATDASGAQEALRQAVDALRAVHGVDVFDDIISRLESTAAEVDDIVFQLSSMVDDDGEEADLDAINSRIHDLEDLMSRWGPSLADVIEWRRTAGLELEDLDDSPERIKRLEADRDEALQAAHDAADALHDVRQEQARHLTEQVNGELSSLAMPDARFEAEVRACEELAAHGGDAVEFLFTPFPGAGRLPLGKSASGGELSRLMLSMELAAADARAERGQGAGKGTKGTEGTESTNGTEQALPTFVFDEVDAGVGGKSAAELGKRLARLAQGAQVIVVTHLAQVASWASAQYVVAKSKDADGQVTTGVTKVTGDDRVREIARMLSGSESAASLKHARELLKSSEL